MVKKEKFSVDLSKPLVFQVGHLGEDYEEWVHQPIISKESPRLYENGIIEEILIMYTSLKKFITRTPWWMVPLFWIPIASWFIASSLKDGVNPIYVPPIILAGAFYMTLCEYLIHRFVFHFKATSYWGITLHYMFHGFHHKHPMDTLRLVLSPAATSVLAVLFWNYTQRMIPAPYSSAFFGGELLQYVLYDCVHYYLHHGRTFRAFSNQLKRDHLNHHFKAHDKGFGVTSSLWDRVLEPCKQNQPINNSTP